jgi:hypothetical protein
MASKPPLKPRMNPEDVAGVPDVADEVREQIEHRERKIKAREAKERKEARPKATYDLPLKVITAVQSIAAREGVSQSDVAALALIILIDNYNDGSLDLKEYKVPCRSVRFPFQIEPAEEWQDQS